MVKICGDCSYFLIFLLLILGGLVFGYYAAKAPTLSEKDLVATTSSKIYDNQNNLIADLGAEKRINVKTNEIPTDLVNAIVAIEDHRFFNHRGIDFIRIGEPSSATSEEVAKEDLLSHSS